MIFFIWVSRTSGTWISSNTSRWWRSRLCIVERLLIPAVLWVPRACFLPPWRHQYAHHRHPNPQVCSHTASPMCPCAMSAGPLMSCRVKFWTSLHQTRHWPWCYRHRTGTFRLWGSSRAWRVVGLHRSCCVAKSCFSAAILCYFKGLCRHPFVDQKRTGLRVASVY